MTTIKPRRSVLYMPGANARALDKARTLPADTLILDLEDSVAPDAKASAREQVARAVSEGGYGHREVVVRVNGFETPWGREDLAAAARVRPDAVLLPKVSDPAMIVEAERLLAEADAPSGLAVWAMIETPLAILRAEAIAAVAARPESRLRVFVMGTNDLAKETRARMVPGRAPMLPWLMTALAAARAHGLDIVDGVFNNLSDAEAFVLECAQGRDLGFDGKTLIHPNQIGAANIAFSPSGDELEQARAIVSAFDLPENAGRGAIALEGRMVERLHAEMARRTLVLGEAIAGRD